MMATVKFVSEKMEVDVDPGIKLIDLAAEAECDMTFGCRSGTCGTCRIRVKEGMDSLSVMEKEEKDFLEGFGARSDERLGCQIKILGSCSLEYIGLDDRE